jgi:hypothetical protein
MRLPGTSLWRRHPARKAARSRLAKSPPPATRRPASVAIECLHVLVQLGYHDHAFHLLVPGRASLRRRSECWAVVHARDEPVALRGRLPVTHAHGETNMQPSAILRV